MLHRTLAFLPSVLLAASWPGLWLAWPSGDMPQRPSGRLMPAPRGRYVGSDISQLGLSLRPDLFGRKSDVGFGSPEVDTHSDAELLMVLDRPAQTLPWDDDERHHDLPVSAPRLADLARRELGTLWVRGESLPVFAPVVSSASRLVVSPDAGLARAGFSVSDDLQALLGRETDVWSAQLWVALGDEGRVTHVVLEKGTGSDSLDRAVICAIYGAGAVPGAAGTSGWVTIEYGRR